jgi:dihydrofolate reductase
LRRGLYLYGQKSRKRSASPVTKAIKMENNEMRNLIYAINLTIDGCFDHTHMIADEEMLEYYTLLLQDADLVVYGRKTYQLMVPYWPDIAKTNSGSTKAENEFAQAFERINKIVFSQTLDSLEGGNTRIVRSDLKNEILKLKHEQGKDILVGGVALPSQLIAMGLIDEYLLVVHPIIAGKGKRLMEGTDPKEKLRLKLVESRIFKSGSVALHYRKQ